MTRVSHLATISLLAALASAGAQQPAPQPSTITPAAFKPKADSLVRAYLADTKAPSAAFAVIRGKDTLAYGAYGLADIAGARAASAANIYEIGSITKQFTSSAIMRLVEQGRVKLDDDMSKYIPQFPPQGRKVSIQQLLNHTSGIHSYTSSQAWSKTWNDNLSPDAIINFVAKDTFDFAPGTGYRYNNTGYVMLGMVIEKVTGQKYADHLAAQFFKPFGLTHTSYCPSRTTDPAFAKGYSNDPNGPKPATFLDLSHPFSAGALCSTVGDLVKWQRALMSGKVVSPESYMLMTTADTLSTGRRINYGFGLVPGMLAGHKTVGHGGGIPGFTTSGIYVADDSLSVVVFTNWDGAAPDALAQNLLRAAYGMAPASRPAPPGATVPLPATERDAIAGNYTLQLPGGQTLPMRVFVDEGRLMTQAQGQGANEIRHLGNHVFGVSFDPALRMTFVFDGGKVTKMTLLQGGATIEGPRAP